MRNVKCVTFFFLLFSVTDFNANFWYHRTQQERAKKRLEFENQKNRVLNQLEFERSRDTQSKFPSFYMKELPVIT
jgi:hypothetical protein